MDKGKEPHPRITGVTNDQYMAVKCASLGVFLVKHGKSEPVLARIAVEVILKEFDLGMTAEEFVADSIEAEESLVEGLDEVLSRMFGRPQRS